MQQPDAKCGTCKRTTETHAPGCSLIECPHRRAQVWDAPEGAQGFPGLLAEDRIFHREGPAMQFKRIVPDAHR